MKTLMKKIFHQAHNKIVLRILIKIQIKCYQNYSKICKIKAILKLQTKIIRIPIKDSNPLKESNQSNKDSNKYHNKVNSKDSTKCHNRVNSKDINKDYNNIKDNNLNMGNNNNLMYNSNQINNSSHWDNNSFNKPPLISNKAMCKINRKLNSLKQHKITPFNQYFHPLLKIHKHKII